MKLSILGAALAGIATTVNSLPTLSARSAPSYSNATVPMQYNVTVNFRPGQGFVPERLFNVKRGDQIIFSMQPDTDHQVVQAIPQDYCKPVPGGLDSGLR